MDGCYGPAGETVEFRDRKPRKEDGRLRPVAARFRRERHDAPRERPFDRAERREHGTVELALGISSAVCWILAIISLTREDRVRSRGSSVIGWITRRKLAPLWIVLGAMLLYLWIAQDPNEVLAPVGIR
jgi:hypothetical protein